jgi:hypothetical protein
MDAAIAANAAPPMAFLGVVLIVAAIKTFGKHEERPQR